MIHRLNAYREWIRATIARHGGGWRGMRSVTSRSIKVVHALGWRGLVRRMRAAQTRMPSPAVITTTQTFPEPAPLTQVSFQVGIMVHVFYPDLLDELAADLAHMPVPFVLMVSVVDESARDSAMSHLQDLPRVQALHVRVVENRGRDIAPLLVTFREEILALDILCHLHTKKSLYTGSEQDRWRRYLMDALLGSPQRVAWILGVFQAMPALGMIYPENYPSVPLWAHTWLGNAGIAREWGPQLGIAIDATAYFDYPAGSMFWARVEALRPLYELGLKTRSFPVESGQNDGTLQHALERFLGLVPGRQHMASGILAADGSLRLFREGSRNRDAYFTAPLAEKIAFAAVEARIVSFDIFDTLVLRPFLSPSGARAWLAHVMEKQFGITHFAELRERAEAAARNTAGHDVDSTAIYQALARLPGMQQQPVTRMRDLELDMEQHLLRPRPAAVEAAQALVRSGHRVMALSDMYLDAHTLRRVLPHAVTQPLAAIHVSCDTHWRKDTGDAWRHMPRTEGIEPRHWLHVGDNEHADVQRPLAMGFIHPVHVLRPAALLDAVPALRSLRLPTADGSRWMDQLWLGLVANRFTELADRQPEAFGKTVTVDDPETLGYTVLGPLVTSYVAWLGRLALQQGMQHIAFLSREGCLLQRIYRRMQESVPALDRVQGSYLLASRRGLGTPTLRHADDLQHVFGSTFTGTLHALLRTRLGPDIADAVASQLGAAARTEVYLPDMKAQIIDRLRPCFDTIAEHARSERSAYLQYWHETIGTNTVMVADLGYAGTIQTHLARLTGCTLGGAYFAVTGNIAQTTLHAGWAKACFHDSRDTPDAIAPAMRYHLLLESMLTSSDGQFSRFRLHDGAPHPVYLDNGPAPEAWSLIERIHDGAAAFTADMCRVLGPDMLHPGMDHVLIQEPLNCLGDGRWQTGSWFAKLAVEDNYTGRGNVAFADS